MNYTATTDDQREQVEVAERRRWIGALVKHLQDAGFTDRLASLGQDRVQYLATRFAMGRRASTLRQRVRYCIRVQEYMMSIYCDAWLS